MTTEPYRDEELLRRWISGELTAPQEADLERRAARDPDLREALDGLAATPEADHEARLAAMLGRAQPTATVRRLPYTRYAAAATVLVLLAVAALLLPRYFDEAEGPTAMNEAPVTAPESIAPSPTNPAPAVTPQSDAAERPESDQSVAVATPPERKMSPPPAEAATRVEAEDREPPISFNEVEATAPQSVAPLLRRSAPAPLAARAGLPREVTGSVTDEDGAPLADAEVRRVGLPLGVTTDSSGAFTLPYDLTLNQLVVSRSGYAEETVEVFDTTASLQISLEAEQVRSQSDIFMETGAVSRVDMDEPGSERDEARPAEGYRALRRRLEENKPEGVPAGKVRVSFLVEEDGELSDFRFRGQPDAATMDYVGKTLVETSTWEVVKASSGGGSPDRNRPVRVYFTLRFE